MRVIGIIRHDNGLNKKITTFNAEAWRAAYESKKKKEPSTFFNYAQRRPIDIVNVTKKRRKKK